MFGTDAKKFIEADHPRGQPENAGQFGPGGGGEGSSKVASPHHDLFDKASKAPKFSTGYKTLFSKDEKKTVRDYTVDGYFINGALRSGGIGENPKFAEKRSKYISQMDALFKEGTHLEQDLVVHRGLKMDAAKIRILRESFDEGNPVTFDDKGYASTTSDKAIATHFAGNLYRNEFGKLRAPARFDVLVPKGTKAIDVSQVTGRKDQSEVVLPRGGSYRVISYHKEGDVTVFRGLLVGGTDG